MDKPNYLERFIKAQLLVIYGIGLLHLVQLSGFNHLIVEGINISPTQAEVIQTNPDYYTDNESGIRTKKRR